MKIDIVIPTYQRANKLQRCLNSLIAQTYKDWECCVIINGGDVDTFDLMSVYSRADSHFWFKSPGTRYVVDSWNYFFKNFTNVNVGDTPLRRQDAIAWIVDDVELYPDYLERLVNDMQRVFPDLDGVVGATQVCPGRPEYTYKPFGQVLLGSKFIQRYKDVNYQVCCPDYIHFYQDEEMFNYANSVGKFYHSQGAVLKHYHPAFLPKEMDDTHPLVRGKVKRIDDETYRKRKERKLNWGLNYERVNL